MSYRRLSDHQLASFATNVVNLLGGSELTAINSAVRTSLATAIGSLPDDLDTQTDQAATAESERKALVSTKNSTRDQIVGLMGQVKTMLAGGLAPKEQFDLCGFNYPDKTPSLYQAQNPNQLSVTGFSNGENKVRFNGNNIYDRVVYEIWRRQGQSGTWSVIGTTRKQLFTDKPVTPGQLYEYRVRAVASKSVSGFSDTAVVYWEE